MLDDGTISFFFCKLHVCIHLRSVCTNYDFLYWSAHTVHLNVDTLPQPQRLCGLENKNQTLFLGPPECTRKLQVYV